MRELADSLKEGKDNLAAFIKWTLLAAAAGVLIGGAGTLFYHSVQFADAFRAAHGWMVFLLPAAGLLIVFCYRKSGVTEPMGTNLVLLSVRSREPLPLRMAPLIFFSTVVTQLTGGSAGREGAALQLGGSLGYQLGRRLRLDQKDLHIMVMCGMSAAFSALFGTPLTAAVFAMEITSVGVMYYSALVPCVFSSVIAASIARYSGAAPGRFQLSGIPALDFPAAVRVTILATLCACVGVLFCIALRKAENTYKKYIENQYIRIVVGGALVIAFSLLLGTQDYLGAGGAMLGSATAGEVRPEAFALKILFTAVTIGAGFKGGEIVPSLFIGAAFGNTAGALLGLTPSFGAGVGLTALFCGVTNCPVTSFILALELFGMDGAVYFLMAAAVSYLLSGYYGLYSEQKILYSKTKAEFIGGADR